MVPRGEKYKNASPNTFKKKPLIIYVMNSIKKSQKQHLLCIIWFEMKAME